MFENPYEILGVSEKMTLDQITQVYMNQKFDLSNKLMSEGEEGANAAKRLQSIKEAFNEIEYLKSTDARLEDRPLGRVEELVKSGDLREAQTILDAQVKRGAEWHYVQAALYYKQGWLMESKVQLELAKSLDPQKEKYAKAYKGLMDKVSKENSQKNGPERSYPPNPGANPASNTCCNICGTLLIVDCCCDCCECL